MANIYWNTEKKPFEDVRKELTKLAVEATDGAFYVDKVDGNIQVYAECDNPNENSCWTGRLPPKFMGWRVLMFNCPTGYIDVFLKPKRESN